MDQSAIDAAIQTYYAEIFDEDTRLTTRSAQGELEFMRTQELITERIAGSSRILDVGGGNGIHAAALAAAGHDVMLIDPVEAHVERARRHHAFGAQQGDARRLDFDDNTFDAALLLGPLYHLHSAEDRRLCLEEAGRVVVPGGLVFAAAIPRFIQHGALTLGRDVTHPYPQPWIDLLEHGRPAPGGRFPGGHFHTAEELASELVAAGLKDIEVHAIEGVAGYALEQLHAIDQELLEAALTLVRKTGHIPGIRDMSNHVMAIGVTR